MLRFAVCDDDREAAEELSRLIEKAAEKYGEEVGVHTFFNGDELSRCNIKFNILFLDIEMPGTNGMETAERIKAADPQTQVVYVTNYSNYNYMKRAYRVHAFDYIKKPAEIGNIERVLEDYLKTFIKPEVKTAEFALINGEKFFCDPREIICVSCGYKKRTVVVITENGEALCRGRINDIYDSLDGADFFMPHRSHIINLSKVRSFKKNTVIMINGDEIPLSKAKAEDFQRQLARKMHERIGGRDL